MGYRISLSIYMHKITHITILVSIKISKQTPNNIVDGHPFTYSFQIHLSSYGTMGMLSLDMFSHITLPNISLILLKFQLLQCIKETT